MGGIITAITKIVYAKWPSFGTIHGYMGAMLHKKHPFTCWADNTNVFAKQNYSKLIVTKLL